MSFSNISSLPFVIVMAHDSHPASGEQRSPEMDPKLLTTAQDTQSPTAEPLPAPHRDGPSSSGNTASTFVNSSKDPARDDHPGLKDTPAAGLEPQYGSCYPASEKVEIPSFSFGVTQEPIPDTVFNVKPLEYVLPEGLV
ncbi:hypothetical protein F2Q70_00029902 [Brassica cretica]|uniref:Uncharacterized protein n=1 Tax=Brassica cretica TaxID=69181 RepID=A0A8S9FHW8_BRACR|nr:hypothetical protein F2Q70_00029902 [Brassica cretica]